MSRRNQSPARRRARKARNAARRQRVSASPGRHRSEVRLRARRGDAAVLELKGTGVIVQVLGVDDDGQPILVTLPAVDA